ncbi:MAG: hypothetical protein U5L74_13920 [Ideonella sp.]|nr:hypothetical protein [Ideonella sp.]
MFGPGISLRPALGGTANAAALTEPVVDVSRLNCGLKARALAPGVWVVEGANADFSVQNGCNIINTGFIATGQGVLVINTGVSKRHGEQLRALIARTTGEPVIQVLQPASCNSGFELGATRVLAMYRAWPPPPPAPAWPARPAPMKTTSTACVATG